MGDFNVNHLNYDTRTATNGCANSLFSNNSLPYINQPTRISAHSSTLLDNMFVDLLNATIVSGNILTQISDHLPQLLILHNADVTQNNTSIYKSEYSNFVMLPSGRASALQPVCRGFEPRPSHTKDFKNGTHCLLLWRST